MELTVVQSFASQNKGLESLEDFEDFKESKIKMAIKNVTQGIPTIYGTPAIPEQRNTQCTITHTAVASVPVIQRTPSMFIPARSASRIYVTSNTYHN